LIVGFESISRHKYQYGKIKEKSETRTPGNNVLGVEI
jgi:hypothetical protein